MPAAAAAAKSLQLYSTLCDPIDGSLPGSSVPGILQARILEWVVIPFSSGSSDPGIESRSPALQVDFLPSEPSDGKKVFISPRKIQVAKEYYLWIKKNSPLHHCDL